MDESIWREGYSISNERISPMGGSGVSRSTKQKELLEVDQMQRKTRCPLDLHRVAAGAACPARRKERSCTGQNSLF